MLQLPMLLALAVAPATAVTQETAGPIDPTVRTKGALETVVDAEITITYDGFGVPNVIAGSRGDAYFAEGFLHAQNRFTQMDMTRRLAAGELSALVGPSTYAQDISMRSLRLRSIARACVEGFDAPDRLLLQRYVDGVNAGLADLRVPPPEYAILRTTPEEWAPEDTVLVMLAFSVMLDSSGDLEIRNAAMFDPPVEVRDFLYNPLSRFDAPVPGLESRRPSIPRIPNRDVISLRDLPEPPPPIEYRYDMGDDDDDGPGAPGEDEAEPATTGGDDSSDSSDSSDSTGRTGADDRRLDSERTNPGSNNWGVSGRLTRDGRAILASDPHLQSTLPGRVSPVSMARS